MSASEANFNQGSTIYDDDMMDDIAFCEIELQNSLGRGTYGQVRRALWGGKQVAVKCIETEREGRILHKEARKLKRISHANIVKLYGVCNRNRICLVMEYLECGSLQDLLHEDDKIQYTNGHAISWMTQTADAVAYLHSEKIVHRDLKPANLLLTDLWRIVKVCDFGTAAELKTTMTNSQGSASWMAPEVFESSKYGEKCDVFSFAVILWQVITRRKPYEDLRAGSALAILWKVHSGKRPPLIVGIPKQLERLMTSCWANDQNRRPAMQKVHKIMQKMITLYPGGQLPLCPFDPDLTPTTTELKLLDTNIDDGHEGGSPSNSDLRTCFLDEDGTPVLVTTSSIVPMSTQIQEYPIESLSGSFRNFDRPKAFVPCHNPRCGGSYETALLHSTNGTSNVLGQTKFPPWSSSSNLNRRRSMPFIPSEHLPSENDWLSEPLAPDMENAESVQLCTEHLRLIEEYVELLQSIENMNTAKDAAISSIRRGLEYREFTRQRERLTKQKNDLQNKVKGLIDEEILIDDR